MSGAGGMSSATDPERQGDFSQSLNRADALRVIHDPWTTQTSVDGKTITRTPYPGNRIPASVQDPIATAYLAKLWKPNGAGVGNYHVNNYVVPLPIKYPYKVCTRCYQKGREFRLHELWEKD